MAKKVRILAPFMVEQTLGVVESGAEMELDDDVADWVVQTGAGESLEPKKAPAKRKPAAKK